MSFNPDPSRKTKKEYQPPLAFNNNIISETNSKNLLGFTLDTRLSFKDHLKMILNKLNKTIQLLRKLQNILPISALLTIYKQPTRPHLDYGEIIYDQAYNTSFHQIL